MDTKMKNEHVNLRETKLIFALMVGYSMIYMDKSMISTAIIPLAEQFNLDSSQTGRILYAFFLGYSLMQIPGGWLADKIGSKKVLLLSLAIISIFSFSFGAVSSLLLFIVIRFFAGIGHGGYPPSCSKSITNNFPQERRTFVQSLILSTSGIGGILAFTIGTNLITTNWQYSYFALGIFFAVSFILVAASVPNQPMVLSNNQRKKNTIYFKQVLTNRNVLILFSAMLLLNFLLYGNMSWLPSYLKQEFSLSIPAVGYLLAVNALFQTLATMFTGVLLSKLFLGKERIFILGATVLSALFLLFFIASSHLLVSMICMFLVSMLSISAFTAIFTWPHKIMAASTIGSSIGIINTGGTLGGVLAPLILGQLIKVSDGSFTLALVFMAVAGLLCGLCVLGVKKEKDTFKELD